MAAEDQGQMTNEGNTGTICVRVVLQDITGRRKNYGQTLAIPDVRTAESVANLRTLLLEIPELCHISNSSHLEIVPVEEFEKAAKTSGKKKKGKGKRRNEAKFEHATPLPDLAELGTVEALMRGDPVVLVPDPYNVQTAWEHIERLKSVFKSPPTPLVNVSTGEGNVPTENADTTSSGKEVETQKTDNESGTSNNNESLQDGSDENEQRQLLQKQLEEQMKIIPQNPLPVHINLGAFYPGPQQEEDGVWIHGTRVQNSKQVECVQSVLPSIWNPPPSHRRLMGDLLYIEVKTLDDRILCITGSRNGFYVNNCTAVEFDPRPANNPHHSKTLAELLCSACPKFSQAFDELLQSAAERMQNIASDSGLTDFDLASFGASVSEDFSSSLSGAETSKMNCQWNLDVSKVEHDRDFDRACRSTYDRFGLAHQAGNSRDWNEDYQSCIELPCKTIEDRVIRNRLLERFHNDFIENAKAGVVAIVEGSIPPLNPSDPEDSHVFVFNHAFFSMARLGHAGNSRASKGASQTKESLLGFGEPVASPVATYSSSNQDLQGVLALNSSLEVLRATRENLATDDFDNDNARRMQYLHTLNTVIVDYMGKRVIAQTIVPGILQNEHTAAVLYGSVNLGKTIACNPEVDQMVRDVMVPLNIGPSQVRELGSSAENEGKEDTTTTLNAPVGCKALKGSDGRIYMLDLMRLAPFDLNFYGENISEQSPDDADYVASLRPELVVNFVRSLQLKWQSERKQVAQEVVQKFRERAGNQNSGAKSSPGEDDSQGERQEGSEEISEWDEATRKEIEQAVREAIENVEEPSPLILDSNLFTVFQDKELRSPVAVESTKQLAEFLLSVQIPRVISDIRRHQLAIVDGQSLVEAIHSYGINLRYLGELAKQATEAEYTAVKIASAESEDGQVREIVIPLPPVPHSIPELCEIEMISRAVKWILRRAMHSQSQSEQFDLNPPALVVANLLNAVFCNIPRTDMEKVATLKGEDALRASLDWLIRGECFKPSGSPSVLESIVAIQRSITDHIASHFNYNLNWWFLVPADQPEEGKEDYETFANRIAVIPLLRRICQLSGVVIASKTFAFGIDGDIPTTASGIVFPFEASDICNLLPVVKSCKPVWCLPEVRDLLETSKVHLQLQNKAELQKAYQLANEAFTLVCQVAGPAHRNAASCCSAIANVMQSANDMSHALELQNRALALLTLLGEQDTASVAQCYNNLAFMYQADGTFDKAVRCLRRAIYLYELMAGPRNGEVPSLYQRLATAYASTNNLKLSYDAIQEAITRSGHNQTQRARYLRTAAHILASSGNNWAAFQCEKSAYAILKQLLGPADPRTQECLKSVERYTRLSVDQARAEDGVKQIPIDTSQQTSDTKSTTPTASKKDQKKKQRGTH